MKATTQLRRLLERDKLIVAPFVFDAAQALIAQKVGFEAVYLSGFGTAMAYGYPDVGLITQTEMLANARRIASVVSVPIIADADTGYGNPINVWRTVREYERTGVAAIHIEDQTFPKKCGFFSGVQLISQEEMVQKLRAALEARSDPDLVVIARTDALAVQGWEEAIRRCYRYREAGADLVFVNGIRNVEDLQVYAREMKDLPKLYNGLLLPVAEVEKLGFKIMITGNTMGVVFKAVKEAMLELRTRGTVDSTRWASREEVAELLGLAQVYEMERRYGV